MVGKDGNWVNREEFTPYGETSFGGFAKKRYRFTGKERDEESGLGYWGSRYLFCYLGRFISLDPEHSLNPYTYTNGNPIGWIDIEGRAIDPATITVLVSVFMFLHRTRPTWQPVLRRGLNKGANLIRIWGPRAYNWVGSKGNQAWTWAGQKGYQGLMWAEQKGKKVLVWAGQQGTKSASWVGSKGNQALTWAGQKGYQGLMWAEQKGEKVLVWAGQQGTKSAIRLYQKIPAKSPRDRYAKFLAIQNFLESAVNPAAVPAISSGSKLWMQQAPRLGFFTSQLPVILDVIHKQGQKKPFVLMPHPQDKVYQRMKILYPGNKKIVIDLTKKQLPILRLRQKRRK